MSKFHNKFDRRFLLKKILNYSAEHLSSGFTLYPDQDVIREIEDTYKKEKDLDDNIHNLELRSENILQKLKFTSEVYGNSEIYISPEKKYGLYSTLRDELKSLEYRIKKLNSDKSELISERSNLQSVLSTSGKIKEIIRKRNTSLYIIFPIILISVIIYMKLNYIDDNLLKLSILSVLFIPISILIRNYFDFGVYFVFQEMSTRFALNDVALSVSDLTVEKNISNSIESSDTRNDDDKISYFKNFDMIFDLTRKRLKKEIILINRRNDTNLIIGILASVAAISTLSLAIFYPDDTSTLHGIHFFLHIAMRISIAVFIEIFAYFFLKLYKNGLDEMRYYQNEITNIDMKWSALHVAYNSNENDFVEEPIKSLSSTERNFILKKGETTIGLEKEKLEKNEVVDIVRETLHLFRKMRKN